MIDPLPPAMRAQMQSRPAPPAQTPGAMSPGHPAADPALLGILKAPPLTVDMLETLEIDDGPQYPVPIEDIELDDLGLILTEDKVDRLCELVAQGVPQGSAASLVGIPGRQLTAYLREGVSETPAKSPMAEARRQHMRQLRERLAEAKAQFESTIVAPLVNSAMSGRNTKDNQWLLEHHPATRKNWGKSAQVEHKGKVSHNHDHKHAVRLADLSPEELAHMEDLMLKKEQQKQLGHEVVDAEVVP